MAPFTFLDHPADLGIRAAGSTPAEAFAEAARALMAVIVDPAGIRETAEEPIAVTGADEGQVLVRFLSEVLYLYDGRGFVTGRVRVDELSHTHLLGRALGEPFDPTRHASRVDVKAVTYHQLRVGAAESGYEVVVYLDI